MGLQRRKHTIVWLLGVWARRNLASSCWDAANGSGAFSRRVRDLLHWAEQAECNNEKTFNIINIKQSCPERMWFPENIIHLMEKIYTPAQFCIHIREHMLNWLNTVLLVYSSFALLHVQMEKIWHLIVNQQATQSDQTSKGFGRLLKHFPLLECSWSFSKGPDSLIWILQSVMGLH